MRKIIFLLAMFLTSTPALANEIGEELVTFHCGGCHGDEMYTRDDRKTRSIYQLIGRVKGCNRVAGTQWDKEQINAVVEYLNKTYYHFE